MGIILFMDYYSGFIITTVLIMSHMFKNSAGLVVCL